MRRVRAGSRDRRRSRSSFALGRRRVLGANRSCAPACPSSTARVRVRGLQSAVTVERDALGIPTIRGISRDDVARATGFVHAQDRFFQMDLARRRAAGELSALVGDAALQLDRAGAGAPLPRRGAPGRGAAGAARPDRPRGLRRRRQPRPGDARRQPVRVPDPAAGAAAVAAEDSLLVVLSMFVTLQDPDGEYESTLATMHDVLPPEMFDLLAPRGTEWDSPIVGAPFTTPDVPGPEVYNLRRKRNGKPEIDLRTDREVAAREAANPWAPAPRRRRARQQQLGGVGRAHRQRRARSSPTTCTSTSACRTRGIARVLEWRDEADPSQTRAARRARRSPATRRSSPAATPTWRGGSPTRRWTASDLVLLELDPMDPNRYWTPWGWRTFDRYNETIEVTGGDAGEAATCAGPSGGRCSAPITRAGCAPTPGRRTRPSGSPRRCCRSSRRARSKRRSTPPTGSARRRRTWCVADRSGRIGWTIYGTLPRRIGFDGQLPESWADGWRGWNGWLDAGRVPADRRSAGRPPVDRQRPRRGRQHARRARRRQLRRGRARARDPRSAARARAVHGARHARHPARRALHVPVALARSDPAPPRRRTPSPATRRARASARSSRRTGPARRRRIRPPTG